MDLNLNVLLTITFAMTAVIVSAQFSDDFGPVPPRPVIPGAVPVRAQIKGQPRRYTPSQLVSDPVPPQTTFKIRRPIGRAGRLNAPPIQGRPAPLPPQPLNDVPIPPRPVIEDPEEQQSIDQQLDAFPDASPSPISNSDPIGPPQPVQIRPAPRPLPSSAPVFRPERPAFIPTPTPELDFVSPTRDFSVPSRQQFRTTASPSPQPSPTPVQQQQFQRQPQPSRQQLVQQQQVLRNQPQKPAQQQFVKQQFQDRPEQPPPARARKPVAQVLRKYREDNEDGSITWGFENDDGSFKEETIGVDCVTRGKYGYIDPDGVRREYSYTSGIPCDKKEDNQEAATNEGYIDYQTNKYVFPNGDSVDLDKMVKNRARKPVQVYRN